MFVHKAWRKNLAYQILYRLSRELDARYKVKMGCELGDQERKDVGLVNGKIGHSLKESKVMCQHLFHYLGALDLLEGFRAVWEPWFSNLFYLQNSFIKWNLAQILKHYIDESDHSELEPRFLGLLWRWFLSRVQLENHCHAFWFCFRKRSQRDQFGLSPTDEYFSHVSSLRTGGTPWWTEHCRASSGMWECTWQSKGVGVFLGGIARLTNEDRRETEMWSCLSQVVFFPYGGSSGPQWFLRWCSPAILTAWDVLPASFA